MWRPSTLTAWHPDPFPYPSLAYKDCAVCAEGYAAGLAYSCYECTEANGRISKGITVVVILIVVFMAIAAIYDTVRVRKNGTEDGEEWDNEEVAWKRRILSCRNFLVQAVPLSAIKTAVVVWQIVTQV